MEATNTNPTNRPTITDIVLHYQGVSVIKTFEGRLLSISERDILDYTLLVHGNYWIACEDENYCIWRQDKGYAEVVGVSSNLVVQRNRFFLILGLVFTCIFVGAWRNSEHIQGIYFGIALGLLSSVFIMFLSRKYHLSFFRK